MPREPGLQYSLVITFYFNQGNPGSDGAPGAKGAPVSMTFLHFLAVFNLLSFSDTLLMFYNSIRRVLLVLLVLLDILVPVALLEVLDLVAHLAPRETT